MHQICMLICRQNPTEYAVQVLPPSGSLFRSTSIGSPSSNRAVRTQRIIICVSDDTNPQ
jgi:hypothetical protein